ncbi:hypothetical protein MBLNU230_g0298t1 [Neophaeotheca triangularis]
MAQNEIKQWVTAQDGLENLKQTTTSVPTPKEGEVLVKINTVSLNYRDTEVCMGLYGHHKAVSQNNSSIVPCSDMTGTVVDTNNTSWTPNARVASIFNLSHLSGTIKEADLATGLGLPLPGVLSEYRCFPAKSLVPVPEYMSDEEACCLPIAWVTAWMALNGMRPLGQPLSNGETVLIQGTGGVAIAGLILAHALGCKTIVTSSSDEKLAKAKALGADFGINYRSTPDWEQEVMRFTGGEGADVILENGGAGTLRKSFEAVAFGGLINCIGYLAGKEDPAGDRTNTNLLALKRTVTLKGILNGPKDRFEEMIKLCEAKKLHPVVDRTFEFGQAKEALQYLFSGSHFGKVVVKVA